MLYAVGIGRRGRHCNQHRDAGRQGRSDCFRNAACHQVGSLATWLFLGFGSMKPVDGFLERKDELTMVRVHVALQPIVLAGRGSYETIYGP